MKNSKLGKVKMPYPAPEIMDDEMAELEMSEEGPEESPGDEPEGPLGKFSDDELIAEVVKRGLADELEGEEEMSEEDMMKKPIPPSES